MATEWTVVAARYGTLATTRSDAYYRWSSYGEPDGPQRLDYYFWVVRGHDETTTCTPCTWAATRPGRWRWRSSGRGPA